MNTAQSPGRAGVPLRIDAVYVRGRPLNGQWAWPADQSELPLTAFLEALSDTPEDWGDAAHCRLHCDTGVHDTVWWLHTDSRVERCVINGEPLGSGQGQRLHDGDEVEVGLLRFSVHTEKPHAPSTAHDLTVGLPQHDQAQAQALFDLTSLEEEDSSGLISAMQRETRQQRSISDLVGDVNLNWLDAPRTQPETPSPLPQAKADGEATGLAEDAWLQEAAAQPTPRETEDAAAPANDDLRDLVGDSADPLQQLHGRYIEHLRNPFAQNDPLGLSLTQRAASGNLDDPLGALMDQTRDNQRLSDVVDKAHTIDDLIAQFDNHSDVDVLAPETFDDVLQLFAPEAIQSEIKQRQQLGLGLPSLTRVEHHSVSLDSPMPVPRAPQPHRQESS